MGEPVKGYKVFEPDWTCKGKQYTCPGMFEESGEIEVCSRGMHFCVNLADCFNYYKFDPKNKVAEVIAHGFVATEGNKSCTDKLEIVRELSWDDVLKLVNSGDYNSGNHNSGDFNSGDYNSGNHNSGDFNIGDYNSGNHNSGDFNSGYYNSGNYNSGDFNSGNHNSGDFNSGDYNSGNHNSGDFNSGDFNSGNHNSGDFNIGDYNSTNYSNGCFNTVEPKITLFNKPSEWTYRDWLNSPARSLFQKINLNVVEWVFSDDMSDEEKAAHPEHKTTGGFLKKLDINDCYNKWWQSLSDKQKTVITDIPNFDPEIFKQITGIDVTGGENADS